MRRKFLPRVFLTLVVFSSLAAAQIQLEFVPQAGSYKRIVQLPNGDRLFVGSHPASSAIGLYNPPIQRSQIALAALGPVPFQNGEPPSLLPVLGGSGNDVPQDAAVDPSGNIWIIGNTDSDDFNLVNPIVGQKVPYRTAGFVLELDPTGTKILFATYLGGQHHSNLPFASYAAALTIDSGGNVYVGGSTNETDFPTTPGAFLAGKGGANSFGETFFYSFLVKISPAGKLVYSTLLGTGSSSCSGGSSCIGKSSTSANVSTLAADASGAVTVAGVQGGISYGSGYVFRVAPDGSKLLWSTSVGSSYGSIQRLVMAQEISGNVDLFGEYAPLIPHPGLPASLGIPGLFAATLNSDGSRLLYSTDLGQSSDAHAAGMALDASGNAFLAGTSSSAQFPAVAGVPNSGADFILRLDASGAKPQTLFRFPAGVVVAPPAFDTSGRLLLLGSQGGVLTLPPGYAFDTPAIVGFANSASYALGTGLYPGELVSLFGFQLPSSLQGVQVLINGLSAPLLYAGPNQINLQVPFGLSISPYEVPQVQVVLPSGSISLQLPLSRSIGIFTVDGAHAAALNQDGTINSVSNPAPRGSIVTLFGTGAIWPSGMKDGAPATAAAELDQQQNKFEVFDLGGTPLRIRYAGAAPGIIGGVFQMNVELPPNVYLPLTLQATNLFGERLPSNPVQVYVK